jgi:hypothetical protein
MLNFRSFVIRMKVFIRHIVSLVMAFLVLFSTISFTVDMHFCGKHLVDFSLFNKAETCGMDSMMAVSGDGQMTIEMDCCSDFNLVQQGQDHLKYSFEQFTFEHQLFVASFITTYIDIFLGIHENVVPHNEYPPPLLFKDIIIFEQQFLI